MNNNKIKSLIEELQEKIEEEGLHTVLLVSDGNNITINTRGILGEQILMVNRFLEKEAEELDMTIEQMYSAAFDAHEEDEKNV